MFNYLVIWLSWTLKRSRLAAMATIIPLQRCGCECESWGSTFQLKNGGRPTYFPSRPCCKWESCVLAWPFFGYDVHYDGKTFYCFPRVLKTFLKYLPFQAKRNNSLKWSFDHWLEVVISNNCQVKPCRNYLSCSPNEVVPMQCFIYGGPCIIVFGCPKPRWEGGAFTWFNRARKRMQSP